MNDMENIKSYWDEISKLTAERDYLLGMITELKDLLAQPEQEPVAWVTKFKNGGLTDDSYYASHKDYVPLYTSPPKRKPPQTAREMYQRGYADGVRFAEKAHGIGVDNE